MKKTITIEIDLTTGEETVEAHGYPRQQCSMDVADVLRLTGAKRTGREERKDGAKVKRQIKAGG